MGSIQKRDTVPRHLVTTADERTWLFDCPVLFLGEWCRRYDRRDTWSGMNAILAEPYGLERAQKDRDHARVIGLASPLLAQLRDVLNSHHGVEHGLRYWRIVLGHWLYRYVSVACNRWFALEQAFDDYEITSSIVLDAASYSLATNDSLAFIWASNDDLWNHVLYSRVLQQMARIPLHQAAAPPIDIPAFKTREVAGAYKGRGLKGFVRKATSGTLQALSRNSDAVVVSSYLPASQAIKLQLRLGQVPQFWSHPGVNSIAPDRALRSRLALDSAGHDGFERFVRSMAMELLPTCYLEGYESLLGQVRDLGWPKRPKFIFTSNNFDTDELFKVWAGAKAEQGVPYVTGQHGTNYGCLAYSGTEIECVATSDKFITWGWAEDSPKHAPAFIFKTVGKLPMRTNRDGGLLLIQLRLRHRIDTWDSDAEFVAYQEEQFRFVESLPEAIRRQVTVRLHAGHKKNAWADERRWRDRSPGTKIDGGLGTIQKPLSNSRLAVHTYNSSGIPEFLVLNIPTLCFWRDEMEVLRASALPYYVELRRAGLLFDSAEKAAGKVAEVWGDVPGWWNSDPVQQARKNFCERYARTVADPVGMLKRILTAG